ncbi:MAG: MBL fold metallo-hydrolase [Thermodesulfobacteriota bacterium]|jgi:glyoxylase-like metal-dependent hydrolase (beta-lactamase superfamily II)
MEEILPRLFRIVVPLPGNPLKEINSYILTSDDRNLIIDTGMNRPACKKVLEPGLEELGVDLRKTDFFITHLHADHQGMVAGLMREGSRAYMGEDDAYRLKAGTTPHARRSPMGDYAAKSGFPDEELQSAMVNHPGFKYGPESVVDYQVTRAGDIFKVGDYTLEVVSTPGHTLSHVCLYERDKKIFFSGDHVLGDITPNIQNWSDDFDPLDLYIQSLKKVYEMEVTLCLPGHRSFITDFKKRVLELLEHHRIRANEVISILKEETLTAYWTASKMTWDIVAKSWDDFPVMQKWFATAEAISHLIYLENKGLVQRELKNGLIYFSSDGKEKLQVV